VSQRPDDILLADHLAGDPTAFDQLVHRYTPELYGFVRRFVGDPAASEDILQDTFIQVHASAHTFDRQRAFRPWLYTIAANKARDYMRSRGRRQEQSLDSPGPRGASEGEGQGLVQSLEGESSDPIERVATDELNRAVRGVVDQMPERLRMILILGYFQQMPYGEIADVLQIPVGTVKSRLHAAVQHFARLWKARGPVESGDEATAG
jgi:RNA polymerase sigma-70 factor (ECF subfamily)